MESSLVEFCSENCNTSCKDWNMCTTNDTSVNKRPSRMRELKSKESKQPYCSINIMGDRTMKCSRITLCDRREKLPRDLEKHGCSNYQRLYQPQLHNYLSWLNKPHTIYQEEQPYLTICNLVLPKNVSVFVDRGAQSEKWVQKRPRLQSANLKTKRIIRKPEVEEIEEIRVQEEDEKDSERMEIQQIIEDYEIDENVQRLIQEAAEYDQKIKEYQEMEKQREADDENGKKRHRKGSKHSLKDLSEPKERSKSRITRTVTLSLSRAPSPETVQVIRVDVTSNYSLEEMETSAKEEEEEQLECYEEYERMGCNRLQMGKSLINCAEPELTLHCQKLALSDRSNCH